MGENSRESLSNHSAIRCVFFQPPKTAFDDYMDYRMNRVHRGAMVRSILNQVELDPKPTRYRPLPITSIK